MILLATQRFSSLNKKKPNLRKNDQEERKWIFLAVHHTSDDNPEERKENEEELTLSKAGKENFDASGNSTE